MFNPSADEDFASFATWLMDQGAVAPDTLEARLRERYPSAVVRPRELAWESQVVWYVYREGRWISAE
jgi:hypothetical protein